MKKSTECSKPESAAPEPSSKTSGPVPAEVCAARKKEPVSPQKDRCCSKSLLAGEGSVPVPDHTAEGAESLSTTASKTDKSGAAGEIANTFPEETKLPISLVRTAAAGNRNRPRPPRTIMRKAPAPPSNKNSVVSFLVWIHVVIDKDAGRTNIVQIKTEGETAWK